MVITLQVQYIYNLQNFSYAVWKCLRVDYHPANSGFQPEFISCIKIQRKQLLNINQKPSLIYIII